MDSAEPSDGSKDDYASRRGVGDEGSVLEVGHSGGQQGMSTAFLIAPGQHVGVIVLTNMEGIGATDLAQEILKAVVGATGNAKK